MSEYLIIRPSVILTPTIKAVLDNLKPIFNEQKVSVTITSGLRDANSQLTVIRNYLVQKKLDEKYPLAMSCKVTDKYFENGKHYYSWQMAWSHLLSIGLIINPPLAAECLMDYIRDGKNKKGTTINQTPHARGKAFDISGVNPKVIEILNRAIKEKKVGLKNILIERENNCIHCDCF